MKMIKGFTTMYKKLSNWGKVLLFVVLFLIVMFIVNRMYPKPKKEGFESQDDFVFKTDSEIYDGFYANIYDYLVFNSVKDQYEVGEIINSAEPTSQSIVLDVGSGTGHHVGLLGDKGYNVTGLDKSKAMVAKAKENYPQYNFVEGDAMNAMTFQPGSFTHILCMYFTIYYIENKQQFFQNCMTWLMSGGHLVVHIVDRDQFDPILPPANPLILLTPQRYAEKRITQSTVVFDDYKYSANFELNDATNEAKFSEKFASKETGKTFRKQEHVMYMPSADAIIQMAQEVGFVIKAKIDLIKAGYEYQYLYVFQKPN